MSNTEVRFRSDVTVDIYQSWGSLQSVLDTARVSTGRDTGVTREFNESSVRDRGTANALIRDGHGVPFESVGFTFYVEAPIFVIRQLVKHRMASMNEVSGRYVELEPTFYIPTYERMAFQDGKPMEYKFREAETTTERHALLTLRQSLRDQARAWRDSYQSALDAGIAREVARMGAPLNLYSRVYFTLNLRSLTNLLSLRTTAPNAAVKSHPQAEIEAVAEGMENIFKNLHPVIWELWDKHGRKAL